MRSCDMSISFFFFFFFYFFFFFLSFFVLSFFGMWPRAITFGAYDIRLMARVLVIGMSPFIIVALDSGLIIATNMVLQRYGGPGYGDQLVTCNTIAQSFFLMITLPLSGMTGATQPILGFNYGAGQMDRVKDGQKKTLIVCLVFSTIMMLAAHTISPYFVRLFTNEAFYMNLSIKIIKILTIMILPLALQYTIVDGFTGLSAVKYAITLSTLRKVLYFACMIVFPLIWGIENVFFAEPVVDFISAAISAYVYARCMNGLLQKRMDTLAQEKGG